MKTIYDNLFESAKNELGDEAFKARLREVFGTQVLDFVETIVLNLPEPCYANCEYCIDKDLRQSQASSPERFIEITEKVLKEFPGAKNVCLTGGTLNAPDFFILVAMIKNILPDSFLTWNTNGVGLSSEYADSIQKINWVNLHRNSVDDHENLKVFKATKKIPTLAEAKKILGKKLCLRITIDENFDLDSYARTGLPLYLNRLLPGNNATNAMFRLTLDQLSIGERERKRRNTYISAQYLGTPVRICVGDSLSAHVPNRHPVYLNVAIIHRSGVVSGSWYEDDKVIYPG